MQAKDRLLALGIIVVWGVNFVVIKVGLNGVPPMLLGALRFSLVALPAIFLVPRPRVPWSRLVAYGATISLGQFAFLFYAMAVGMPAGLASLVLQSQVFFTVAFAALFLREPVRWHHVAGMAVAAAGLVLIGSGVQTHAGGAGGMTVAGFLLTLCGAACWATGNIVSKTIGPVDLLGLVVWGRWCRSCRLRCCRWRSRDRPASSTACPISPCSPCWRCATSRLRPPSSATPCGAAC